MATVPPDRAEELQRRGHELLGADYFTALGVSRGASREQVSEAFIEAAKTWHPDRAPAGYDELKGLFAKVFARLEQARATLSEVPSRMAYLEQLTRGPRAGQGAVDRATGPSSANEGANKAEASLEFKKAEVLLKKNDAKQAEAHLRRAVQLAPTVVQYGALLTWVQVKPSSPPDQLARAIADLDDLIAQDNACARAYFYRAQLHKRVGRDAAARSDFERAVELEPANIDAAREVRLYEMRESQAERKPKPDGSEGALGFFKKLFKR